MTREDLIRKHLREEGIDMERHPCDSGTNWTAQAIRDFRAGCDTIRDAYMAANAHLRADEIPGWLGHEFADEIPGWLGHEFVDLEKEEILSTGGCRCRDCASPLLVTRSRTERVFWASCPHCRCLSYSVTRPEDAAEAIAAPSPATEKEI